VSQSPVKLTTPARVRSDICSKYKRKRKVIPYLFPSTGPEADPSVQTVSLQVNLSHLLGRRLPLLSAGLVVIFPAKEHHRP